MPLPMSGGQRVTVCVGTYGRPYCIERLIRSIRVLLPDIPIIVGDQNRPTAAMKDFYEEHNVEVLYVGLDAGVAKARQECVDKARTEYVLVCDDDFIFSSETSLEIPLAILDQDPDVDIVGGLIRDVLGDIDAAVWSVRRWEKFLFRDRTRGLLVSTKIDAFSPICRVADGHPYFFCDTVLNWKVVRKSAFARGARWDPAFKCNGEHEDFYLNIRENTELGVAYCPDFVVYHHNPLDFEYSKARADQSGWIRFAEKWGLRENLEIWDNAFRSLYVRGEGNVPAEVTTHPAWLPNQATFPFRSPRARSAGFEEAPQAQLDAGETRRAAPAVLPWPASVSPSFVVDDRCLRLVHEGAPVRPLRANEWFSAIVRIVNTGPAVGCCGPFAPVLGYRVLDGTGAALQSAKRLTKLHQDIVPGSSHHLVNLVADWSARPGQRYTVELGLWTGTRWMGAHDSFVAEIARLGPEDSPLAGQLIAFNRPEPPACLASLEGLSHAEPWGRWSDGNLSKSVVLGFAGPLPRNFVLELRCHAFAANADSPAEVRVGTSVETITPGSKTATHRLTFALQEEADQIIITPPYPISPAALGIGHDRRSLGIGLVSLRIVGLPAPGHGQEQ